MSSELEGVDEREVGLNEVESECELDWVNYRRGAHHCTRNGDLGSEEREREREMSSSFSSSSFIE